MWTMMLIVNIHRHTRCTACSNIFLQQQQDLAEEINAADKKLKRCEWSDSNVFIVFYCSSSLLPPLPLLLPHHSTVFLLLLYSLWWDLNLLHRLAVVVEERLKRLCWTRCVQVVGTLDWLHCLVQSIQVSTASSGNVIIPQTTTQNSSITFEWMRPGRISLIMWTHKINNEIV